jgi:phosphoglycerate dehydrogenase-like enzyme
MSGRSNNDRSDLTAEAGRVIVAVVTPLEAELAAVIRSTDPRVEVRHEPDLLPPTRFPGDHRGDATFRRTDAQEDRWRAMLGSAEVFFGLPGDSGPGLAQAVRIAPRLRWVQGTAAGTGEQVRGAGLAAEDLDRITVTTSSGIHGSQLAEFAFLGLLALNKDLARLIRDKAARRWDHYPVRELAGQTMLIVGFGSIGEEIARRAKAFGMRVIGVNRSGASASPNVDKMHGIDSLHELLPAADAVVLALPSTHETRQIIDAEAIGLMREGAILVNVGRGAVVDEDELVAALESGRLRGAALDVFATEPLPPNSPLWDLPNVFISPHTAALSIHENARIVELFCENLRRYLAGEELINRIDPRLMY